MDDRTDSACEERHVLSLGKLLTSPVHLDHSGGRDNSMHYRHAYPSLLKNMAILNNAGHSPAALLPHPSINSEGIVLFLLLDGSAEVCLDLTLLLPHPLRMSRSSSPHLATAP